MTESTSPGGTADDDAADDGREPSAGLARWQKVVGLIGLAVLVALVLLLASSDHGPGRHAPGGSQHPMAVAARPPHPAQRRIASLALADSRLRSSPTDVEGAAGHDPSRWRHR